MATGMTAAPAKTMDDILREQAAAAMARGQAAVAASDMAQAKSWFGRARSLLPADPAIALALAGVLLQHGDPLAVALYAEAAAAADTRECWLGLAAARLRMGDLAAARTALAKMLSGHVLANSHTGVAVLASLACADSELAGWCGVARTADGAGLHWVSSVDGVRATIDGARLNGPALPPHGRMLALSLRGRPLLGSPIDLSRLRRVEGVVSTDDGGLSGWAWLPSDADRNPWITVSDASRSIRLQATDTDMLAPNPLSRPRRFVFSAKALAGFSGSLTVTAEDGLKLLGSPLDPAGPARAAAEIARRVAASVPALGANAAETVELSVPATIAVPPANTAPAPERPVAIVVPAYRDLSLTRACLASVFASCPEGTPVFVVDDASPEPDLADHLDTLAKEGRIILIRHAENQGFPASANAGMRAALWLEPAHDVLLLNSDTLLPIGRGASWLERLRAAVHASTDIGTATPLSNDGSITSYPMRDGGNPLPDRRTLARLDTLIARTNASGVVDIPTAVGFCMYIRRECALQTGLFRPALFAQGYGEENDFCLRARHLGWRHVAATGVFVAHGGSASFGAARSPLLTRNLAVLERLYPGYHAGIAAYQGRVAAEDALAPARRQIDKRRWAEQRREGAIILLTHDSSGGVERVVRERAAHIRASGLRAIVLRPVLDPDGQGGSLPGLCRVGDGPTCRDFPNLVFHLPGELAVLTRLLKSDGPVLLEVHHRLGHAPSVLDLAERLKIPTAFHLHDYASFCPRITLLGPERRYCGEPTDIALCNACVADSEQRIGEEISVADLRARSAAEFARARRVVVPSADMASRLRRHFPLVRPEITPLEHDAAFPPPHQQPPSQTIRRICVIGAIGVEKGYDVLLACARDAASNALPLEFVLVGHSSDDDRLMATGRVFVTGRYAEANALAVIRSVKADLAFLPSIWPETWGFTLGLAWRAGLRTAVFDIGAMAARVRACGHGTILPLGLSASATNQALLAISSVSLAAAPQDRLWTQRADE